MPRMPCTRIFVDAPGLRPTASAALKPTRPTPMAAPRQPRPPWMLPVISAMTGIMFVCFLVGGLPPPARLARSRRESFGSMGGVLLPFVGVAVVADEADVDAHEQREDERLHQADEQLEDVKRRREDPFLHAAHCVHEAFPAENIAEEPQRE